MCLEITPFRASARRKIAKQPILVKAQVQVTVHQKCPVLTRNYIPFLTENFLLCGVTNYIPSSLQYGTTVGMAKISDRWR
jgi:hypothetical protein